MNKTEKKQTKQKSSKFTVRLMAWILAILMILSLAVTAIVVIVDQARADHESEVEHDHDGDGKPDHADEEHQDTDGHY